MSHRRRKPSQKSTFSLDSSWNDTKVSLSRPIDTRPRPGQNRFLEAEEEDYFNADDDEDDIILPSISQQARVNSVGTTATPAGVLSPGKLLSANPNINSLKRKRRGDVMGRGHRPPLRPPALKPLVDYGEDEDEEGVESKQIQQDEAGAGSGTVMDSSPKLAPSPIPSTGGLAGGPPKRVLKEEEDEDMMLETLVRGRTPAPGPRPESPIPRLSPPPTRGEKRRRVSGEDDDDDELFSRLTKPKKQQVTAPTQQQNKMAVTTDPNGLGNRQKNGDDPPKKIKVKIGGFGSALARGSSPAQQNAKPLGATTNTPTNENTASVIVPFSPSPSPSPAPSPSPSPAPSDSGTKDGDTG